MLAKVSGRDVPSATMVMALIDAGRPTVQPNKLATAETIAVMVPIIVKATMKAAQPPYIFLGGMIAKANFQNIQAKWNKPSNNVT